MKKLILQKIDTFPPIRTGLPRKNTLATQTRSIWEQVSSVRGFTFIELMVVVGIIGILSGVFVTQYPAIQRRARDTERRNDIKQYQTAMEAYANGHNGSFLAMAGPYLALPAICAATALDLPVCPDDPDFSTCGNACRYRGFATATSYMFAARLEQPPPSPNPTWFIVCSTGEAGELTLASPPASPNCPL